ncbi:transcriptional activator hap3-like [Carex rostrata]
MEGNMEFVTNNGLSTEDNENIPAILALPASNAPPGGPGARLPFCQNNSELPDQGEEQLWDEDLLLPLANIMYTMRTVLPADAGVPSDVAAIIQRATSDFILLVTSQARERYNREKNKKVKGDDIIWALNKLDFIL